MRSQTIRPHALFVSVLFTLLVGCGGNPTSSIPEGANAGGGAGSAGASDDGRGVNTKEPAPESPQTPSSGCASSNAMKAGDHDLEVTAGGRQRKARVHVPASYDASKPSPVVLNFHGRLSNPSQQELISKTTAKSDAAGFVVVYPEGIGQTWNAGLCCGEAQSSNIEDVAFTRALLDTLTAKLCVDTKRIFATGLSNGAFMSHRLACELADRIAAIAPVAGQLLTTSCTPSRPIAVMHFHGDADAIVSYEGKYGMPGADASTKSWATRNGCGTTPKETYAKGDTKCSTYSGCTASAEVTLCTITGGGHTWPGGVAIPGLGKTSTDIDATSAMWDFFTKHPMP